MKIKIISIFIFVLLLLLSIPLANADTTSPDFDLEGISYISPFYYDSLVVGATLGDTTAYSYFVGCNDVGTPQSNLTQNDGDYWYIFYKQPSYVLRRWLSATLEGGYLKVETDIDITPYFQGLNAFTLTITSNEFVFTQDDLENHNTRFWWGTNNNINDTYFIVTTSFYYVYLDENGNILRSFSTLGSSPQTDDFYLVSKELDSSKSHNGIYYLVDFTCNITIPRTSYNGPYTFNYDFTCSLKESLTDSYSFFQGANINPNFNFGSILLLGLTNFLSFEIVPNFSLLSLLALIVGIPLLIYLLKLFLGG